MILLLLGFIFVTAVVVALYPRDPRAQEKEQFIPVVKFREMRIKLNVLHTNKSSA